MDIEYNTGVYCLRNTKARGIYIGSTIQSFAGRKNNHLSELRRNIHGNPHLQNAWNKYGEDAFEFQILKRCHPNHTRKWEQKYLTIFFNSWPRKYIYNVSPTAENNLGVERTEEHKNKLREAWNKPGKKEDAAEKTKEAWNRPGEREKRIKGMQNSWTESGAREKKRKALKKGNAKPEAKMNRSKAMKEVNNRTEVKDSKSKKMKQYQNDEEWTKDWKRKLEEGNARPESKKNRSEARKRYFAQHPPKKCSPTCPCLRHPRNRKKSPPDIDS